MSNSHSPPQPLKWYLSCRSINLSLLFGIVAILYGHFLYDPGEKYMLQIATLYHNNVTFFTNLPNKIEMYSIDDLGMLEFSLYNDTSFPKLFHELKKKKRKAIVATSLTSQTCYVYNAEHLYGAFCTPPAPASSTPSFNVMFGSCLAVNPIPPFQRLRSFEWAYNTLKPTAVFVLGDLVYTDVEEKWLGFLRVPPRLAWYRTWQVPSLERLFRIVPAIIMHDDHEIENGWNGEILNIKHERAMNEMMFWTNKRRRQTWNYGQDVSTFILDTRTYRHTGSILGQEQWSTLKNWLNHGENIQPPKWRIIASPSLVADSLGNSLLDDGDGGWNMFPNDKMKLLALINNISESNIIIISG
jgi:phosphodiesterase/alkaline phosphatase D-like protein